MRSQCLILLTSMRKAMDNPEIPSNRLDDIVNSLAESGARCKTLQPLCHSQKTGSHLMTDALQSSTVQSPSIYEYLGQKRKRKVRELQKQIAKLDAKIGNVKPSLITD